MQIAIDIAALCRTRSTEWAVRFLLGGAVTAVTGLIAKEFGATTGGLFLAFPTIFPASATLIEKRASEERSKPEGGQRSRPYKAAADDAVGAAIGSLGLLAFALVVSQLLRHYNPLAVLTIATMLWLTTSALAWRLYSAISETFGNHAANADRARLV
jgi:hypothetical protein